MTGPAVRVARATHPDVVHFGGVVTPPSPTHTVTFIAGLTASLPDCVNVTFVATRLESGCIQVSVSSTEPAELTLRVYSCPVAMRSSAAKLAGCWAAPKTAGSVRENPAKATRLHTAGGCVVSTPLQLHMALAADTRVTAGRGGARCEPSVRLQVGKRVNHTALGNMEGVGCYGRRFWRAYSTSGSCEWHTRAAAGTKQLRMFCIVSIQSYQHTQLWNFRNSLLSQKSTLEGPERPVPTTSPRYPLPSVGTDASLLLGKPGSEPVHRPTRPSGLGLKDALLSVRRVVPLVAEALA